MIATPTPIAVPSAEAAVPSAAEVAFEFAELRSVSAPPAATVSPFGIDAIDELSAIVNATAAATETPLPPLSSALGAAVPPEPCWPAGARPSAAVRSCAIWPFTSCPGAFESVSPGAPAADAVEDAVAIEEPSAWKETAPPAVRLRSVVASASWSANVSASAIPTAASSPSESPAAVVAAEAVSSAIASIAPLAVSAAASVPRIVRAETFEIVTAIAGATATAALAAPVRAVVVSACTAFARSVTSAAPVTTASSSIVASAWSLTTAIAIEAPIPTDSGVGPLSSSAGSASTFEVAADSAFRVTLPPPAASDAPVAITAVVVIV